METDLGIRDLIVCINNCLAVAESTLDPELREAALAGTVTLEDYANRLIWMYCRGEDEKQKWFKALRDTASWRGEIRCKTSMSEKSNM